MDYNTIPQLFYTVCEKYGDTKPAYLYKKDDKFTPMTHSELKEKVECLALGLLNLGIRAKDRIGIVSENRIEWPIVDMAIVSIGAIDVPLFPTLTSKQEEWIFNDCGVSAVIVSNNYQLSKILEFKDNMPSLRHIIVMNDEFKSTDLAVKSLNSIICSGKDLKTGAEREKYIKEIAMSVQPDDLLTLIYTSGTTGNPKGVMLTHFNVVSNVIACMECVEFVEDDVFLSYLPWCHSYERTAGYYSAFATGATTGICESMDTIASNMIEIRPTIMTTVPRLLEMIKKKIYANIAKEKIAKQKIFKWSVSVGKKYLKAKLNNKIPIGLHTKYKIADKLVFAKIREKTGGRLKKFVSGGAALSPDVNEFFMGAGLNVLEGYGLTEASPVVSITRPETLEIGTIGQPIPRVEVKIADDGEILARGPNVMKGYWNDPQATEHAIDEEGWLYTGDIGHITSKGNIKITDRKKYIFVSSGGKNIAPQPIENLLAESPFIDQCFLLGDKREFVTALITPDFEQLKNLADSMQIKYSNPTELISNKFIIKAIKNDIDRLQKDLAKFERVRKFTLLSQPFTVENGELTPKMSVRRHVVERKYSDLIDQLYGMKD